MLPLVGLAVAVLAYVFGQATDESAVAVLLSGQDALPELVSGAGAWSVATLALLILCKGLAYAASMGSFRGGPTFPALFLGAAGGVMASHLPGLSETPAVAVCMAAATVSVLRLPLSAAVLAIVLTPSPDREPGRSSSSPSPSRWSSRSSSRASATHSQTRRTPSRATPRRRRPADRRTPPLVSKRVLPAHAPRERVRHNETAALHEQRQRWRAPNHA